MQFSRIYYVIWTNHVSTSLCVPFSSRVLFLCVTVYLSNSNTDSDFDSPSLERESVWNICKWSRAVWLSRLISHTHTPHQHGETRGIRYNAELWRKQTVIRYSDPPNHCVSPSKRPFLRRNILKRTQPNAPTLTRSASVVIASTFCSQNNLIRARKRPNMINRDTTHVNNKYGCLLSRHEVVKFSTMTSARW